MDTITKNKLKQNKSLHLAKLLNEIYGYIKPNQCNKREKDSKTKNKLDKQVIGDGGYSDIIEIFQIISNKCASRIRCGLGERGGISNKVSNSNLKQLIYLFNLK